MKYSRNKHWKIFLNFCDLTDVTNGKITRYQKFDNDGNVRWRMGFKAYKFLCPYSKQK